MRNRYFLPTVLIMLIGILTAIIQSEEIFNRSKTSYSSVSFDPGMLHRSSSPADLDEQVAPDFTFTPMDEQITPQKSNLFTGDSNFDILSIADPQLRALLSGNADANGKKQIENKENTFTKPEPVSKPVALYNGEERVIGYLPQKPVHNPGDEFFYLEVKEPLTSQTAVYLEYDLYGVEDNTQVSRSINDQPVFGGYVVKQHNSWSKQSELINPDLLKQGINTIRFSIAENAKYSYKVKNLRFRIAEPGTPDKDPSKAVVVKSKKHNPEVAVSGEELEETGRRLIVNQPTTAYYYRRFGYVQGFVTGVDYDKALIRIGGQKVRAYKGEFESMVSRNSQGEEQEADEDVLPSHAPWSTTIEAVFPDGEILKVDITFEKPAEWDHLSGFDPVIHFTEKVARQDGAFLLTLGSATLQGEAGSLQKNTTLSITALRAIDLPRLNPGMVNVTAEYDGYRFLPHGSNFEKPLNIILGYDSTKLPRGHYPQEVRTYYYDESRSHWVALPRDSVNKGSHQVCSRSTHFTDMINAIVKAPEMPETQEYTPTSLKELQAADPSSGIQMMQPPTANSQGTATLSYPINVPAGRQGMQPNLAVSYSSEAANGLLGMGWDMNIPAITVDTKWGVPRYYPGYETETYLYNGEELLPSARLESSWEVRDATKNEKQFYPRVESGFEKIMRKGNSPSTYYWIITDKQGTQYYYGTYTGNKCDTNVLLKDKSENIAHWPLCKVIDINGNYMQYCYTIRYQSSEYQAEYPVTSPADTAPSVYLGQQLWLDAISYTGHGEEDGAYKVVFSSKNCSVEAARIIGCDILENKAVPSVLGLVGTQAASLSQKTSNAFATGRELSDIIWEDVPDNEDLQNPENPEEPDLPCYNENIRVQVCVESPCRDINLNGATFWLGTDDPVFQHGISTYPLTFNLSPNPGYTNGVSTTTASNCAEFMVCSNKKYHLVVIPPSNCSKDPVHFSFRVDRQGNVSMQNENGIPMIRAYTSVTGNARDGNILFKIPVECDCSTSTDRDYCYDCWEPCTPYCPPVCRKKVYIGVQDDFCKYDKLPLCRFDLVCESDPYQTVYHYTTGYAKIQPLNVRCDEWYWIKGTYFGANYQDTTIAFRFKIDNNNVVHISHVDGIHSSANPNIIENYYNNGYTIELLMPVVPKTKQTRIQIVNSRGQGVPNHTFLLGNASNGERIEGIYTTNFQGYTPILTLEENAIYYIGEVDITAYDYNLVGAAPYSSYTANWPNKIQLYLMQENCVLRMGKEPGFSVPDVSCSSGLCTFVYREPERIISKYIHILKITPDWETIDGVVFRVNDATDYIAFDGFTDPIPITNGQTYVLQEKSVPPGFLLDDRKIYITMNNIGVVEVSSQMDFDYEPTGGYLILTNQRGCPGTSFMVRKQDATTGKALEGALIQCYNYYKQNNALDISLTDSSGRTHEMTMECEQTYYIKEDAVPPGYKSDHPAFVVVTSHADGSIEILDSAQLHSWTKVDDVWVFTFVNHKKDDEPVESIEPDSGCSSTYAYDNTINARNGFRQSSKEKLSKIVVFYRDSCVRTYTFCYTQDFYGRALLEAISQWGSEDTIEAYTHTFTYYNDAGDHRNLFQTPETLNITDNQLDNDRTKRIAKKLRNFFTKGVASPSVLGGSRTWSTGINSGGDIGLFPAFPLKTLSAGVYVNGSISSSKGKTTMIDINGDGLPDRVYNVMEGIKNRTYYCLQKPGRGGFETERKPLDGISVFLQDFSDNASIGLQASAFIHGGIQKGFLGNSWTDVYFADMNGDGFVELVSPKGVKSIGKYQSPPRFTFPDCLLPEITITEDSIKVRCDTGFSFTPEVYERDRTEELRYDLVRVWQADMDLKDLTYSICAPVHLAYNSIALENFCGTPDSVIVSIEYYGKGLTGDYEHILLWSDVIGNSDTTVHGPNFCELKIEPEPDPEPCRVMLRKRDHRGNPLGNVVFKMKDGTELVTDAANDGLTPAFYISEPGSCVEVTEMMALPHCFAFSRPFTICKGESGENGTECEITLQGSGFISHEWINGEVDMFVHVINLTNDCNENPMCFARILNTDRDGNSLEGVKFDVNNGTGNGLSLTTDSKGLTSLFNIFAGGCSDIHQKTLSSHCYNPTISALICADDACNISINSAEPITFFSEWVNGMLIHTIIVKNDCDQPPCKVRIQREDQHGNLIENVTFRVFDGRGDEAFLTTTNSQGLTPFFYIQQRDGCIEVEDTNTLSDCNNPMTFYICIDPQCNISVDESFCWVSSEWIDGKLTHTVGVIDKWWYKKPVPCPVVLRKEDPYSGEPLGNVVFELSDGTELITDVGGGYTPVFYPFQENDCITIKEIVTLPHCVIPQQPYILCRTIMANGECIVTLQGEGYVRGGSCEGELGVAVTLYNDCDQTPGCLVRVLNEDQYGNRFENMKFRVSDATGNEIFLTTNSQGLTPLIKIPLGATYHVHERISLSYCNDSPIGFDISVDNNWNIEVNPPNFHVSSGLINGILTHTITVVNHCYNSMSISSGSKVSQVENAESSIKAAWVNGNYDLSALKLAKGDKLFFRVRPQNNGVKKKVVWDPAILPYSRYLSRTDYLDENNRIYGGGNKASQSQLLQGDSLFPCPMKGRITIESMIDPLPLPLSDMIEFEIWANDYRLYHYTIPEGNFGTIQTYTTSIDVDTSTRLKFKVLSKGNVNMHQIQWYPKVYYNYLNYNNQTIDAVIADDNGNSVRMLEYVIAPYHDFYHTTAKLSSICVNKIYDTPPTYNPIRRKLSKLFLSSGRIGKVYITIKQDGRLCFARKVSFNRQLNETLHNTHIHMMDDPDKPVYISCYVDDPDLATTIISCYVVIDDKQYFATIYTKHERDVLCGEFYGGWGQFLYQTNSIPDESPFSLMDIKKIEWLSTLTSKNIAQQIDTSRMGGDSIRHLRSFAQKPAYDQRLAETKNTLFCIPMFNEPEYKGHVGYYPNAFIRGADMNIGGLPCPEYEDNSDPCNNTEGERHAKLVSASPDNKEIAGQARNDGKPPSGDLGAVQNNYGNKSIKSVIARSEARATWQSLNSSDGGDRLATPSPLGFVPRNEATNKQITYAKSGSVPLAGRNVLNGMDPKKTSSSENTSYTAGVSVPGISIGLNESTTTTSQENDMMDLNGDGFPDIIRNDKHKKGVYYSFPQAGLWEENIKTPFNGQPHHKTVTNTFGSSFTADPMGFISVAKNSNKGESVPTKSKGDGVPSVTGSKSETRSEDRTLYTLIDINGDGLPDRVYNTGKNVALNLGYSFDGSENWELKEISLNVSNAYSGSFGIGGGGKEFSGGSSSYSGGLSKSTSYSQSKEMLADINGDGLPDKIVIADDRTMYVHYNTGCGFNRFADIIKIGEDDPALYRWNTTSNMGGNFGITLGFPIVWWAKISMSGGADVSFSLSSSNIQFMDLDGDGYADLLIAPNENTLIVRYSNLGRTGLLKSVTNPMGGSMELAYHKTEANVFHSRRWVMDTIKIRDNFPGDGADVMMTTYEYEAGYYDRKERAFYGFAKITENHHNTENGNEIYRKYLRYYYNNNFYYKGLNLTEAIQNGENSLYILTMNRYNNHTLTRNDVKSMYVTLDTTVTCYFEGQAQAQIRQEKTWQYETTYGRVIKQTETSTDMPVITATITYHHDPGNYRVAIPSSVEIEGYRKRTTTVDNKGQMTSINDYYDNIHALSTQMFYDNYGNCKRIIYPNHSYSYVYDDQVHTYPVSVRDTFGCTSYAKDYDFRFGVPLTVIDKSGYRMEYTLDQFGRTIEILAPKEQNVFYAIALLDTASIAVGDTNLATGKPINLGDFVLGGLQISSHEIIPIEKKYTVKYIYRRGNVVDNIPYSAITCNYDPANPGHNINTYTYSDGLGRIIQTKRDAEIAPPSELYTGRPKGMIVSGKVVYDAFGRTVKTEYPTIEGKLSAVVIGSGTATPVVIGDLIHIPVLKPQGNLIVAGLEDEVPPSIATYDILDRPLIQRAPDGTKVSYKYGFGSSQNRTLFETEVTDQNDNISTSLTNINKQQYEVKPTGHEPVWFEYNDIGDLLKVEGVDFSRSYLYDGIGRRTEYKEDSLKETYRYDGINLVEKNTYWNEQGQQHKTINYTYNYNRLATVQSFEYRDAIEYKYNNKGKVDTIKDASGIQLFKYGSMGEVTNQTRIYTLPFMDQAVKLETRFEYDSWGRTLNMTYPDGEKVMYEYDYGGQLRSMKGIKDSSEYKYLESMTYDKFGAKTQVKYSNGMTTTYSYNPQNLRLHEQNMSLAKIIGQTIFLQDYLKISYTYDPKGNIRSINTTNYTLPEFSTEQTFIYNEADQLDSASGNDGNLYTVKMSYGNYGRVNTYNTTFTDPQINGSTQLISTSYAYQTTDAASNSFAPVSANNGDIAFEYGINGSMRKRTTPAKAEYYYFNAFDQMKAYGSNGSYGYYNYDDAGKRIYKIVLSNIISRTNALEGSVLEVEKLMLYPNGYININQNGEYTKHYYADAARIASKIGTGFGNPISNGVVQNDNILATMKRELCEVTTLYDTVDNINYSFGQITHLQGDSNKVEEGLFFYHGNHLSSTQMVTDMHGGVTQAVLYTPWGNIISEYRQDWMLDTIPRYLWNAKEKDEESGMYYFEARYYSDEDIVFRGRDPKFEKYFWLSPYCAMANNPMKFIDPDGKTVVITGEAANEAFSDMSSRSKNLTFGIENGKVSIIGGKAKTKEEKYMQKIINDQNINVTITAQKNDQTNEGKIANGGAFMGNSINTTLNSSDDIEATHGTFSTTNIEAKQTVNISTFRDWEANKLEGCKTGSLIWHEISEGYEGGKISMATGIAAQPARRNALTNERIPNPTYDRAHYNAGKYFPGTLTITPLVDPVTRTSLGNEYRLGRGSQP